jgi:predicted polyphosphate/ATP-dependent NAD kinase
MTRTPRKIALLVNPIAGMGGKVGLKGTDGVLEDAIKKGAEPVAPAKVRIFLGTLKDTMTARNIEWHTAGGDMGESALGEAGLAHLVDYTPTGKTTADDTKKACREFLKNGCELVVFCGGDGTARDVNSVTGRRKPVVGIPSGVKMHSAVFAITPKAAGELLLDYLQGALELQECEIMDLDEDAYRNGEWKVKLFGIAVSPFEPARIQGAKLMMDTMDDEKMKTAIAEYILDGMAMDKETLYIIGPGSTTQKICELLGTGKTLLGVDCLLGGKLCAKDVSESEILALLDRHEKTRIIVSPIGAQGFIFGRGNLQISERIIERVIERVGLDGIIVVSTPAKLARTPVLRVDVSSQVLRGLFRDRKYIFVITGYQMKTMRNIAGSD